MKSALNKIIAYTLFGLLNLLFANPWNILMAIIVLGAPFQATEENFEAYFFIWLLLLLIKHVFIEIFYKKSKDIRELLNKAHSVWQLLGIALIIDIFALIIPPVINFYSGGNSPLVAPIDVVVSLYPYMLGGITTSYLFFALRKKHIKIKGYNKE